jgi:hypothetical protein
MSAIVPEFGINVARQLSTSNGDAATRIFHQLLSERQLSRAVSELNTLLNMPEYQELSHTALQRLGLEFSG